MNWFIVQTSPRPDAALSAPAERFSEEVVEIDDSGGLAVTPDF
jgi:hypothetical protein